mgnify:CR=1 FL=1
MKDEKKIWPNEDGMVGDREVYKALRNIGLLLDDIIILMKANSELLKNSNGAVCKCDNTKSEEFTKGKKR